MWHCEIHIRLQVINIRVSNKSLRNLFCTTGFQVPCSCANFIKNFAQNPRVFHLKKKYFCHQEQHITVTYLVELKLLCVTSLHELENYLCVVQSIKYKLPLLKEMQTMKEPENHGRLHKCLQAGGSVVSVAIVANSIVKHSSCLVSNIKCAYYQSTFNIFTLCISNSDISSSQIF